MFVTVSWAGDILASSDGIKWKQVAGRYATGLKDVIWTGEKFVAVGETKYDDEPEYNRVFVSTDGENWTYYQAPDEFQSIAWDGNVYVAVANGNNIYLSYDCVEWELVIKGYMDEIWFNRVMWGGGKFIAHGAYYSMCSEDGYKWRLMPSTAFFNIRLRDIIWMVQSILQLEHIQG